MANLTRYALWLAPDEAASTQLQSVIDQLAASYSGPRFTPHMTLLGWVRGEEEELVEKTASLAARLAPIEAKATGFAGAPYYFRCFFAPLESSSSLRQAVGDAAHHFGASAGTDHMPHVSLLYGQIDREEKKKVPQQIGERVPRHFTFDRLQLIRMSVSVSGWEVVTEVPLTGSGN
ncbi:MAG: 2'-5' RNA ligase family protein [Acidiferrobacterales bacterium]